MADRPRPPKWSWTMRLATLGVVVAVVGLLVVASDTAQRGPGGGVTHPAVEVLTPAPNAQTVPRQQTVTIDLVPGWTAELEIDRIPIPLDQHENYSPLLGRVDDGLWRVSYVPAEGKVIEVLPQGRVCVTAFLQNLEDESDRATENWCFDAA